MVIRPSVSLAVGRAAWGNGAGAGIGAGASGAADIGAGVGVGVGKYRVPALGRPAVRRRGSFEFMVTPVGLEAGRSLVVVAVVGKAFAEQLQPMAMKLPGARLAQMQVALGNVLQQSP